MRAVGLRELKNRLSEYVRLAASGQTVLVPDRGRVVAELVPPRDSRADTAQDALLAEAVRKGVAQPAPRSRGRAPAAPADGRPRGAAGGARRRPHRTVIYADSSVVLAQLLAEDRYPEPTFWDRGPWLPAGPWSTRSGTGSTPRGLGASVGEDGALLLGTLSFLELVPLVLARALEPFSTRVRTLDALHLASIEFLRGLGQRPSLATYDRRLAEAAASLGIPLERSERRLAARPYRPPSKAGSVRSRILRSSQSDQRSM